MILNPNQIIRDHQINGLIGQGGMGEVYLAKDLNLERNVAIKVLRPELTLDPVFAERFKNEARVQASLIHANIISLYSFFEENKLYFMVMEYSSGLTLDKLIRQINLIPEARALKIFEQICIALDFAHSRGVIHRDIKPSNIMVDTQNKDFIKILDFGIARMVTEAHLTRTGTMLGTINYMSPEQVLAEKDLDHRSDIFSAGIVLYEMLTGRLPYDVDTQSTYKIQEQIINQELPDPLQFCEFIRPATVDFLMELTQKNRDDRPDNILTAYQEFTDRLKQMSGAGRGESSIYRKQESGIKTADMAREQRGEDKSDGSDVESVEELKMASRWVAFLSLILLIIAIGVAAYRCSNHAILEDFEDYDEPVPVDTTDVYY